MPAEQLNCDRCDGKLRPGAAYCEVCGARTRRARRLTRTAVRIELLALVLVAILIFAFAYFYYTS
jgi:hypothetical protein